mmetsp:Transcript_3969/g.10724  ORF Transcript_3969/g.10724 Transcript_3969/m.10724 type:complete len:256 (+) Transcript_3969:148-915(+)
MVCSDMSSHLFHRDTNMLDNSSSLAEWLRHYLQPLVACLMRCKSMTCCSSIEHPCSSDSSHWTNPSQPRSMCFNRRAVLPYSCPAGWYRKSLLRWVTAMARPQGQLGCSTISVWYPCTMAACTSKCPCNATATASATWLSCWLMPCCCSTVACFASCSSLLSVSPPPGSPPCCASKWALYSLPMSFTTVNLADPLQLDSLNRCCARARMLAVSPCAVAARIAHANSMLERSCSVHCCKPCWLPHAASASTLLSKW